MPIIRSEGSKTQRRTSANIVKQYTIKQNTVFYAQGGLLTHTQKLKGGFHRTYLFKYAALLQSDVIRTKDTFGRISGCGSGVR